jgi:hypothetical protein
MVNITNPTVLLPSTPLIIYDKNGSLFYRATKNTRISLPVGVYTIVGSYTNCGCPKPNLRYYKASAKVKKTPRKLKVSIGDNPNKCTVNLHTGNVLLDKQFLEFPQYVIDFIKNHETAHYIYNGSGQDSEIACDRFACNIMLMKGYNPSQINAGFERTLDPKKSALRIKKMNEYLKIIKV